jgi:hypothetical protein
LALHAHVLVPGPVLVHVAFGSQPPWLMLHESTDAQDAPVPEYPVLQVHVLVPGPVDAQVAFGSQPPWLTVHESMAAQDTPVPEYPVLQVHVLVPGPVDTQVAFVSQTPASPPHESIAVQVVPFPEYPVLQVQVTRELTTAHVAFRLQPPLFVAHDAPTAASASVTGPASVWTSGLAPASTRSPAPPPAPPPEPAPPSEPPTPARMPPFRAVVHPAPIIAIATRPAATTKLERALGFESVRSLTANANDMSRFRRRRADAKLESRKIIRSPATARWLEPVSRCLSIRPLPPRLAARKMATLLTQFLAVNDLRSNRNAIPTYGTWERLAAA